MNIRMFELSLAKTLIILHNLQWSRLLRWFVILTFAESLFGGIQTVKEMCNISYIEIDIILWKGQMFYTSSELTTM